jgi:hypothetical protein
MRWLDHVIAAAPNFFASAQIFSNCSTSPATRLHSSRDEHEPACQRKRRGLIQSAIRNRKSKIEMSRQSDSNRRRWCHALNGTWLVVLPACETGSGQAQAGEGVMGLRRGFILAGAQNLLMTLWPISDETTVQIMLDLYDAALRNGNAPQALAHVSRDWLVKLRKDRGLLDAVRLAGSFIISSQGEQ